jgi:hypothetical protein
MPNYFPENNAALASDSLERSMAKVVGGLPLALDFMFGSFYRNFADKKTLNHGIGPAITFTRASNATFFDATGTLQTAGSNVPRFDHSGGNSLGLLIEEQRTNRLLNSATLATQTVTVTAVAQTLSFYGTGEIVLSGVHSATVTGTGAFPTRTTLTFTPSAGTLTLTVSGTVENAQLETGSFATSYIPTTGSTATRAADSAVVTPISSFYNASEGTLFVEAQEAATGGNYGFLSVDDNTNANRLDFRRSSSTGLRFRITNAGSEQASIFRAVSRALQILKLSGAYSTNDAAFVVSGGTGTDSTVILPTTLTHLRIGNSTTSSDLANGHLRKVAYWPKRLSNTLLEQLST